MPFPSLTTFSLSLSLAHFMSLLPDPFFILDTLINSLPAQIPLKPPPANRSPISPTSEGFPTHLSQTFPKTCLPCNNYFSGKMVFLHTKYSFLSLFTKPLLYLECPFPSTLHTHFLPSMTHMSSPP